MCWRQRRTPILAIAALVPLLAGCTEDAGTGPSAQGSPAGIVFPDPPADVLRGDPLPPVRVRVVGPDGRTVSSATGALALRVNGASAGAGAEKSYELIGGEAVVRDLVLDELGDDLRLTASWNERVGSTPPFAVAADYDAVRLNVDGEAAVYAEGGNNRGEHVRRGAPVEAGSARVGLVRSLSAGAFNRAIAFGAGHAPTLATDVQWTAGADTVDLTVGNPVDVDLTVWLIDGSPEAMRDSIMGAVDNLQEIWSRERAGWVVGDVDIIDARHDPDVGSLTGREATYAWLADLETRIGAHAGRINVYAVPEVRQGNRSLAGVAMHGGNVIALAPPGWRGATLAHEIGHNFGLDHTDDLDGFDAENIMYSRGGRRAFLTEGQIARMHFGNRSVATGALDSSDGGTRPVTDGELPPLELRLWADGAFPAAGLQSPSSR